LAATAAPISSTDTLASGPAARLTALFTRLDEVYNSDALDKIAVEFAYLNSKAARNRLIKVALRLLPSKTWFASQTYLQLIFVCFYSI
jgi:regulator of nonsense transcripts 2